MSDILQWLSVANCLLVVAVFYVIRWLWRSYQLIQTFKKLGIPGPAAVPVLGNVMAIINMGFTYAMLEWPRQFGKVYGFYLPSAPTLVISDLDIAREVMVKKFSSFPNRGRQPILEEEPFKSTIVGLRDDHWRYVRGVLSPTFSSGKVKKMFPAIDRAVRSLVTCVQEKAKNGEMVELKSMCGDFAMDSIAGAAFGMQVDTLHNPEEPFAKHAQNIVNERIWLTLIRSFIPPLGYLLRMLGITAIPQSSVKFFSDVTTAALKERHEDEKLTGVQKYSDFLQLLVEAEREGKTEVSADDEIDHGSHLKVSTKWPRKGLEMNEILASALAFIMAGYGTVSSAMAFTLFCLAAHPEHCIKVQEELDCKLGKNLVTYETANELTYLGLCLNEALRIYPPAVVVNRQASEDVQLGSLLIPKDMQIFIPVHAIHTDPNIWPEPQKFDPLRHTPEACAKRHPYSFMPFGIGPRNCIGMRLALLEIRVAVAAILHKFSPVLCEKSVYPPRIKKQGHMEAEDNLWVKFETRTNN